MKRIPLEHNGRLIPMLVLARKGCIPLDRHPLGGVVWQKVGDEIYMTCGFCGEINRITPALIDHFGKSSVNFKGELVDNCATCVRCGGHNLVKLRGWTGESFRECSRCVLRKYGKVKNLQTKDLVYLCRNCKESEVRKHLARVEEAK